MIKSTSPSFQLKKGTAATAIGVIFDSPLYV
ncbi:hypothetical protein C8J48_3247 [Desmospora activa DSM 45169]|uniref:Uncharacterized protein n=1 Tax=Desmospora activa DSM 45169 TaxID=1121389 RepID=A0A2T4Z4U6_9BACL|nr:hypothetical protein C8J48_3247 [Desmospora activa DSM 45169]